MHSSHMVVVVEVEVVVAVVVVVVWGGVGRGEGDARAEKVAGGRREGQGLERDRGGRREGQGLERDQGSQYVSACEARPRQECSPHMGTPIGNSLSMRRHGPGVGAGAGGGLGVALWSPSDLMMIGARACTSKRRAEIGSRSDRDQPEGRAEIGAAAERDLDVISTRPAGRGGGVASGLWQG